jgi:hypothetical protein
LEDRVEENDARADYDGERRQQRRAETDCAGVDDGFGERHTFADAQ